MTFTTVNTKAFLKELEWTARFTDAKTSIPVISAVQITTENGVIRFAATDLEVSGLAEVPAETGENFQVVASVKQLIKYLKKVEEPEVKLSAKEKQLTISHGTDAEVSIDGLDTESFPVLPTVDENEGTISGLATALPRILMSISGEESRFTLNGALLDVRDGQAVIVSTDGHRLSVAEVSSTLPDGKLLIPKRALSEVERIATDEAYSTGFNHDFVRVTIGTRTIISRKMSGNFPDYERVMPRESDRQSVELAIKPLQKVLDRVALFADERSRATRWEIEHAALTVSASVSERGKAKQSLPLPTNGISWNAGFNAEYITQGLKHMGETCQLFVKDSNSAALFSTDAFKYVVMPMRI
jgi:DNA polymerase-3 subunit beta